MAMVKFATTCDVIASLTPRPPERPIINRCGKRSAEYTAWPSCRECGDQVCPDCTEPKSWEERNVTFEGGVDAPIETVVCKPCAEANR